MRKLITGAFVSLDGVMQAPGGPEEDTEGGFAHGGWVAPHFDEALGRAVDTLFANPFDLLLGRRTYEIFSAHWPHADPADELGARLNAATKHVASRSGAPLPWGPASALSDAAADVARLKASDGPDFLTQGSADLLQTLFAADLVDEIAIFTVPITLGLGKRLFGAGARPAAFVLAASSVTPAGVVCARYVRAGAVRTGDFSIEPPGEAELARRDGRRRGD